MATSNLIDPALLKRLENVSLISNRTAIIDSGDRLSHRRGSSLEFSDYREYRPGDDLRYVDWKAYGRLDKLFLKLYQDEKDISLHLLIDNSRSMSFGEPVSKWRYAQRAAAAIGFIALHKNHRVDVAAFSVDLAGRIPPLRGDSGVPHFLAAIERLSAPSGETNFARSVQRYAASAPPGGVVVVFSDFYDPTLAQGLTALAGRRHDVSIVQVLDQSEVDPNIVGDFSLTDSETGQVHDVTLAESDIAAYRNRAAGHKAELASVAARLSMNYLQVVTTEPLDNLVLYSLRRAGVLK
jgi:uncharacterized protein (DUF58 family)